MGTSNNMKTSWRRATAVAVFLLMPGVIPTMGSRCYAQTQAQRDAQMKPASEVPDAVAKELQAMNAHIGQLESRLNNLAASVAPLTTAAIRPARPAPTEVTLTGKVSCGHCEGIQTMHKGYTQFSWAFYSVSQGDDIVLVARDKTYKLHGDIDRILKFMCDQARVTGRLEGTTLQMETIGRATKNE